MKSLISEETKAKLPMLMKVNKKAEELSRDVLVRTGTLRFISDRGRQDLTYFTNDLSTCWYQNTLEALNQLIAFAISTRDYATYFKKSDVFKLIAYADASHIRNMNGKSRIAGTLFTNEVSGAFFSFSSRENMYYYYLEEQL